MPVECTSFLQQLVEDLFDPSLGDNPDLEHKSGGLKDLLKTGFRYGFVRSGKKELINLPLIR